MINPIKVSNST